ncbi:SLAM family member 8-like isoform X1 [Bufo gargarizans]|uniref:SLAM family member 8-like isoform X1 n=1 Tax=Bufo gargarizans TaxID=30331 RepID=UPI001CF41EB0|nr:SLAM family member 8-like isoform X1 [Bufo gargarizans]
MIETESQYPRSLRSDLVVKRSTSITMRMDRPLLTLIFIVQAGTVCTMEKVTQIIGKKGGAVHLPAIVPPKFNTRDVFWRHLSPTDHLVASFSRGSFDTTYQSWFYERVQLLHNFTLVILNLELVDTGIFTCQMVDTNGHMRLHRFHLIVYEVVVKPEVQVYTSKGTADCSVFLACNASTGNNVTYGWTTDTGEGRPLNRTFMLHDNSRLLKVLLNLSDQEVSFTCMVANPVSQEKTVVTPWNNCFVKQGTDVGFFSGKVVLVIGIFLVVTFAVLMFLVFLLTRFSGKNNFKNRRKKTYQRTTSQLNEETGGQEEDLRLQNSDVRSLQRETTL